MHYTPGIIAISGVDGSGKTTLISSLCQWLEEQGINHIHSREPGGTPLGEKIRDLVLNPDYDLKLDGMTEAMLMLSARKAHVQQVIEPALKLGQLCLLSRYEADTYAYQVYARGADKGCVERIVEALDFPRPLVTIILDVPEAVSLARVGEQKDRIEEDGEVIYPLARAGFRQYAKDLRLRGERCYEVDATEEPEQVLKNVVES